MSGEKTKYTPPTPPPKTKKPHQQKKNKPKTPNKQTKNYHQKKKITKIQHAHVPPKPPKPASQPKPKKHIQNMFCCASFSAGRRYKNTESKMCFSYFDE